MKWDINGKHERIFVAITDQMTLLLKGDLSPLQGGARSADAIEQKKVDLRLDMDTLNSHWWFERGTRKEEPCESPQSCLHVQDLAQKYPDSPQS